MQSIKNYKLIKTGQYQSNTGWLNDAKYINFNDQYSYLQQLYKRYKTEIDFKYHSRLLLFMLETLLYGI